MPEDLVSLPGAYYDNDPGIFDLQVRLFVFLILLFFNPFCLWAFR
jgi:hypothetical protein